MIKKKLLFLNLSVRLQSSTVTIDQRCSFSVMSGTEPGQFERSNTKSDAAQPRPKKPRTTGNFEFRKYAKRHVALRIAYLGWSYHGFAIQKTPHNTIEAHLFEALEKVKLVEDALNCNYSRCGRTDKGVSALGQVVSLTVRSNLLEAEGVEITEDCTAHERKGDKTVELPYMAMLNSTLPEDIRVLSWAPVGPDFNARFNCLHRTYKYFFPKGNLDISEMREAAQKLVGEHDFRNFCRMDISGGVTNFRRRILSIDVNELSDGDSPYQQCEITIVGLAFLWHQVRCMVAILFLIGHGLEKPEIIDHMLDIEKCPSKPQYGMASELPLVLYDSVYEGVEWRRCERNYVKTVSHFQQMWTEMTVKSTMLRRMLDSLELSLLPSPPPTSQVSPLCKQGGGAYKPLLSRPTSATLEERLADHKRKRARECQLQEQEADTDRQEQLQNPL
ncbi:tRNA pseudouridine(38/39) synthase [Geodia barretti]|uniref:tRNA pseudouridine(38/39) synthase n=2 Tax=Geodia barretti TaxID=519541 RepID=A0AA35T393_GEOBA|nr:tRNA pseudouridine(38/39) synthase [Geodia barretti]